MLEFHSHFCFVFFQYQVAGFLAGWVPRHPLAPNVRAILTNYTGTRGKLFGVNTINLHKKNRVREFTRTLAGSN